MEFARKSPLIERRGVPEDGQCLQPSAGKQTSTGVNSRRTQRNFLGLAERAAKTYSAAVIFLIISGFVSQPTTVHYRLLLD